MRNVLGSQPYHPMWHAVHYNLYTHVNLSCTVATIVILTVCQQIFLKQLLHNALRFICSTNLATLGATHNSLLSPYMSLKHADDTYIHIN